MQQEAIVLGIFFVTTDQLHKATGPECLTGPLQVPHWHANTGVATGYNKDFVSFIFIDPGGCGLGKVAEVPVANVSIGTSGVDVLSCDLDGCVMLGGPGNDQMTCTGNGCEMYGHDGSDAMSCATTLSSCVADAGAGNDNIQCTSAACDANGGLGLDNFTGGNGNDIYKDPDGVFSINSEAGSDTIITPQNIFPLGQVITINTGAGNDNVNIGGAPEPGSIVNLDINLGVGADVLYLVEEIAYGGNVLVNAADGNDFLEIGNEYYSPALRLISDSLLGFIPTASASFSITLNGGDGDDFISSGSQDDTINGGPGSDNLKGNGGNDMINGEGGRDFLDGGDGTNALDGGDGDDNCINGDQNNCEEEAEAFSLKLFEGGLPSDGLVNPGQEVTAVIETIDPLVSDVLFRWIDPDGNVAREVTVPVNSPAQDVFTPTIAGKWIVEADFLNGTVLREDLDVSFMVLPESSIGVVALLASSLGALAGYRYMRSRKAQFNA
jgi:hypothetical protein